MSEAVEWALHSCLNLTWIEPGEAKTAAKLAAFYDLPTAYLNKHLQALARAGIVSSAPGPRGGFRLARPPERITVLDIVTAIEGSVEAFRCQELLRNGPDGRDDIDYRAACVVSQTMRQAELAWRRELAGRTLADIKATVERRRPGIAAATRSWFARQRP